MQEVYVLCGKDKDKKIYYVEKHKFKLESRELGLALARYNELKRIALKLGYSIEEKVKSDYKDREKKENIKIIK